MKKISCSLLALLLTLCLLFGSGCFRVDDLGTFFPSDGDAAVTPGGETDPDGGGSETVDPSALRNPGANPKPVDPADLPAFGEEAYIAIGDNFPNFAAEEMVRTSFEYYGPLDSLGRCTYTVACIGPDLMPDEERGSIGTVKPSGWQTVKYDIVSGKYLYNRCHLIGYQLTGENANVSNLITGTRYLNIDGMLVFEDMVADYIKETGNHVLYRATPIFVGDELVARGVEMEGYSVEDDGEGICFHVYSYNAQPGIVINYANGDSALAEEGLPPATDNTGSGTDTDLPPAETPDLPPAETPDLPPAEGKDYVLNKNTGVFHLPTCSSVTSMAEGNRVDYTGTAEELIEKGYSPCGRCHP